jgi:hypothetical protein
MFTFVLAEEVNPLYNFYLAQSNKGVVTFTQRFEEKLKLFCFIKYGSHVPTNVELEMDLLKQAALTDPENIESNLTPLQAEALKYVSWEHIYKNLFLSKTNFQKFATKFASLDLTKSVLVNHNNDNALSSAAPNKSVTTGKILSHSLQNKLFRITKRGFSKEND